MPVRRPGAAARLRRRPDLRRAGRAAARDDPRRAPGPPRPGRRQVTRPHPRERTRSGSNEEITGRPGRDPGGGRRRARRPTSPRRSRSPTTSTSTRCRWSRSRWPPRSKFGVEDPGRRAAATSRPSATRSATSRRTRADTPERGATQASPCQSGGIHEHVHRRRRHRARRHHAARRGRRVDLGRHARRPVRGQPRSPRSGPATARPGSSPGWPSTRPSSSTGSRPAGWTAASRSR